VATGRDPGRPDEAGASSAAATDCQIAVGVHVVQHRGAGHHLVVVEIADFHPLGPGLADRLAATIGRAPIDGHGRAGNEIAVRGQGDVLGHQIGIGRQGDLYLQATGIVALASARAVALAKYVVGIGYDRHADSARREGAVREGQQGSTGACFSRRDGAVADFRLVIGHHHAGQQAAVVQIAQDDAITPAAAGGEHTSVLHGPVHL